MERVYLWSKRDKPSRRQHIKAFWGGSFCKAENGGVVLGVESHERHPERRICAVCLQMEARFKENGAVLQELRGVKPKTSTERRALKRARRLAKREAQRLQRHADQAISVPALRRAHTSGMLAYDDPMVVQFYESLAWKQMRLRIFKRDGNFCACCGRRRSPALYLNIDHIKPLRKHWALRLDPTNLQVLCADCNEAKGNWDETDWRAD